MTTGLGLKKQREGYRSVHATTSRLTVEEKLRKLRTFKHWRGAGHAAGVIAKRLRTTRESLKRWAVELGFDLGMDGRKGAQKGEQKNGGLN